MKSPETIGFLRLIIDWIFLSNNLFYCMFVMRTVETSLGFMVAEEGLEPRHADYDSVSLTT